MSPEAPVPIIKPTHTKENGGMAYNTYNNLVSLEVDTKIITNEQNDIRKVRYVDNRSNQMILRVDENDRCDQIEEGLRLNICNNKYENKTYDAIVISDYCKGFLSKTDIKLLCRSNKNVFVDTKKQLGKWIQQTQAIKINSFDNLLEICNLKKEVKLKYELEKNINLVSFENQRIEISFNDDLDKEFIKILSSKLNEWTGNRWIITLSKKKGEPSKKEKEINLNFYEFFDLFYRPERLFSLCLIFFFFIFFIR
jgi:bifunctional ADP-heptose synthase (sugar kinase/adenylyltransferase)